MGSLGDVYELAVLDALLGQGFTKDIIVYVALCTTAPTDTALGAEPSGNGYARVAMTNNATNWPNAAAGQKTNGTPITFPAAVTAGWGVITHFMIMNHATGTALTNMIVWGALGASRNVAVGDIPQFAATTLVITAD